MPHTQADIYQTQRLYVGIGWKAPLSMLDAPEWSDAASGNPLVLEVTPADDEEHWEPLVTDATDEHGWVYATVVKHLEYKRPGGRSSARFGDNVRRRRWQRHPDAGVSETAAQAVLEGDGAAAAGPAAQPRQRGTLNRSSTSTVAAAAARAAREAEANKQAVSHFVTMVMDLLSRRPAWTLVPWDPTALPLLYKKHQEVYSELQAQAFERRLFTADQPAPPSQLREGRTLLQDLLCAATHSRAAYGFPAAEGLMGSVADFVRLQTLQPLSFDAVGGVSAEANNESVAALAGLDPADILMSEWRNSVWRPCHYVAIDRANECIVLSVRGSLQVGDLLSDLVAAPMEVEIGGSDGWVHQGIFASATYLQCNTQAALQEAARRCPGWPLLLTGHSLGGGTAALLTLLLQQGGLPEGLGPMRCITVGTAAVMSEPLAAACDQLVTSVIVGADAVPHLSLASVEALLVEAGKAGAVRKTVEEWGNKLAEALGAGTKGSQGELSAKAAAATSGAKISGSWAAVKDASARLGKTASGTGLARLLTSAGVTLGEGGQQQGAGAPPAADIPVVVQQQAEQAQQPQWQQLLQRQAPAAIPVIDQQQQQQQQQQEAAAAVAAHEVAEQAAAARELDKQESERQEQGDGKGVAEQAGEQQSTAALEHQAGSTASPDSRPATTTTATSAAGGGSGSAAAPKSNSPGDPQLLFPPGRLIWIFPAEEEEEGEGEAAEEVDAGAELQLAEMDLLWQGGGGGSADMAVDAVDAGSSGGGDTGSSGSAQKRRRQEGQAGAGAAEAASGNDRGGDGAIGGGGAGGASRRQYEVTNTDAEVKGGRGSLDMEEAEEAVEGDSPTAPAPDARQQRQAVAVDADRSSFERLLVTAEMLTDHLPDRYLAALRQL